MIAAWVYLGAGLVLAAACLLTYLLLSPAQRSEVDDGLGDLGLSMPTLLAGVALLWPVVLADLARKRR